MHTHLPTHSHTHPLAGIEQKMGGDTFDCLLTLQVAKDSELLSVLQKEMAAHGYLVFRGQEVLTGDEQCGMDTLIS